MCIRDSSITEHETEDESSESDAENDGEVPVTEGNAEGEKAAEADESKENLGKRLCAYSKKKFMVWRSSGRHSFFIFLSVKHKKAPLRKLFFHYIPIADEPQ